MSNEIVTYREAGPNQLALFGRSEMEMRRKKEERVQMIATLPVLPVLWYAGKAVLWAVVKSLEKWNVETIFFFLIPVLALIILAAGMGAVTFCSPLYWLLKPRPLKRLPLKGVDLREEDLAGVDLAGVDLRGADLRGANLCGTSLCGADLRGAKMAGVNFCGADLRMANVGGADFVGATLRGADFTSADVSGTTGLEGGSERGAQGLAR